MEKNKVVINISELRLIVDSIFLHMEKELALEDVELTQDYYWSLPDDVLFMGEVEKEALEVGSLVDDLQFLLPLIQNRDQASPLMLTHVAPILNYLAKKVG